MSEPPSAPPPPPPSYGGGYGQGGYGQGPYGQDPYGQPYQPGGQTSTKAIVALVLGIASFLVCGIFLSVPAIFVGRSAQREIDASGGRITGRGLATAGFILGIINAVLSVIAIIAFIAVFATGSSSGTG
jgi:hypothetical protein